MFEVISLLRSTSANGVVINEDANELETVSVNELRC